MGDGELEQRALARSLAATLAIAGLGIGFGVLSGSQSVLFDGVFSLIDAGISALSLWVAQLVMRQANRRFQHGYWHLEPMVAALNGGVLLLASSYAFLSALQGLLGGGRRFDFGVATAYAGLVALGCLVMYRYTRRLGARVDSELLRIDAQSWLHSGAISAALLVGFVAAGLVERTRLAPLSPYVDPALLALVTLSFIATPIGILRQAAREILLIAPEEVDRAVQEIMAPIMAQPGLKAYTSYVAKTGRGYFVEINLITEPDFAAGEGVRRLDAIRAEIDAALAELAPLRWLTVTFSAEQRWA